MDLLKISGIHKQLSASFRLTDIHFTQQQGQKIAITGETGSGKSSLLKIIAGLLQPDAGTVWFNNSYVQGPDEQLIPGHPGIAYLSQDHELRNNYRIEELLEYANKLPAAEAGKLYRICRIDHLMKRKNVQLSGGEKQRIALARLLVGSPKLLLLDEPFSNLDIIHKKILKSVIENICIECKTTCILTSHDPVDTLSWADELMVMRWGTIVETGKPETVYAKPRLEYTAGLFGSYTLLNSQQATSIGITLSADSRLLLRPRDLFISTNGTGIKGIISGISFHGGFYEITVAIDTTLFTIIATDNTWHKGQSVFVVIQPDSGHILY